MYLSLQRYSRPANVGECLRLLHEPEQQAALLAGGTELNVRGHEQLTHVIDTQALAIDEIAVGTDVVRLGAGVTLGRIRRDSALDLDWLTALRQAASAFQIVAIQNRSTLGGRIMVDRPDQDVPPALLALGAQLRIHRLRDSKVQDEVIDYPVGAAQRAVLDGAVISEVLLPTGRGPSALRRFGRSAVDRPLATCAAAMSHNGLRLTANLQGPGAGDLRRLSATEKLVASWDANRPADWRAAVRNSLLVELRDYGDAWASGNYRRDITSTLLVRALASVLGEQEIQ